MGDPEVAAPPGLPPEQAVEAAKAALKEMTGGLGIGGAAQAIAAAKKFESETKESLQRIEGNLYLIAKKLGVVE